MITLIRLARIALVLVLAFLTLSFVMGIGAPTTGWIEKLTLLGFIAVCVYLAAQVSTVATRLQERAQRQ